MSKEFLDIQATIGCGFTLKGLRDMIGRYRKSWKKFDELGDIDRSHYCSNYYDVSVNKYGFKCGTSFGFWENIGWTNPIDPDGWFHRYLRYWLGRRSLDDERKNNKWKGIVTRFKGKLIKMIKDVNGKFNDYCILPKIRQVLLHWGYELVESVFLNSLLLLFIQK